MNQALEDAEAANIVLDTAKIEELNQSIKI